MVGSSVLVLRPNILWVGELDILSEGVFLQSSKEKKMSVPSCLAFFMMDFAVLMAFLTLPLLWG